MYCTSPHLNNKFNQTNGPLRIGLLMDGVTSLLELSNTSLMLYPDPTFETFAEELLFSPGEQISLILHGSGFEFSKDQIIVQIEPCISSSTVCQCTVTRVFSLNDVSMVI